ncbi:hypothetical protein D9X30_4903 [Cupriavidus sp. U2]|uniref:hypothetical protein n=1 Tax=Cupriavidus sp. U2 TaxID=2920269 RepID=UPI00129DBBB7|nr:hypothetical protein [Cupriavidus sp. U2]KAI3589320.1 hypothetical protein D9X30_4903 [Cupriavidus sp. U2]
MIRSPAQIKLMALGLPDTPYNFGGKSSSSSASTNTTTTNTTTTYQDRRVVADGGSNVVSADQSNVFITNTDNGAVNAALNSNTTIAGKAIDATTILAKVGADMAAHTQDVTQQLFAGSQALAGKAMAQDAAALQVVQSLASLPTKLNDPNRAIVIVGMSAVAIAAVMMMRGKL